MAVNGGARKLSAKQEKAILALLSTRTVADAAEQSGVGVRTLERWLSEDEIFIESFRDVRTRVMEQAIARLQNAATEAVETLKRNLSPPAPPSAQIRAAIAVLEFATKGVEQFDLIERIDRLYRAREEN